MCVTHSAVSHRIRSLEEIYGIPLLTRKNRGVFPTEKGTKLLGAVRHVLDILNSATEELVSPQSPLVRVGVGHAFARNWLIERLDSFYRLHPNIELEIHSVKHTGATCPTLLSSDLIDIAICYGETTDWLGYNSREIFSTNLFPVCGPEYNSNIGPVTDPKQLLDANLLRMSSHSWSGWFKQVGLKVSEEELTGPLFDDIDLMLNAAVNNQGIALARDIIVDFELATNRLIRLFDLSIPSAMGYHVVSLPSDKLSMEVIAFSDWLLTAAENTTT